MRTGVATCNKCRVSLFVEHFSCPSFLSPHAFKRKAAFQNGKLLPGDAFFVSATLGMPGFFFFFLFLSLSLLAYILTCPWTFYTGCRPRLFIGSR